MVLLYFAHPGEAKEFLNYFAPKAEKFQGLYKKDETLILIAGEGEISAMIKLPYLFAKYPIRRLINMGIAGALKPSLEQDEIFKIRTSYAFSDGEARFHSFSSTDAYEDCITVKERVLDKTFAAKLSPFASIVDRELWGIARACKEFHIEWDAYKLISDYAGENTECLSIQHRSDEFSLKLLKYYLQLDIPLDTTVDSQSDQCPLPMTMYQQSAYRKTMHKLRTTYPDKEEEDFLTQINTKQLLSSQQRPKARANELIKRLQALLNPIESSLAKELSLILAPLTDRRLEVKYDRSLEQSRIWVKGQIEGQKQVEEFILALREFDYNAYQRFLDGDIHV